MAETAYAAASPHSAARYAGMVTPSAPMFSPLQQIRGAVANGGRACVVYCPVNFEPVQAESESFRPETAATAQQFASFERRG